MAPGLTPFVQITGANTRCARRSEGYTSHSTAVAGASTLAAAVAPFRRSADAPYAQFQND